MPVSGPEYARKSQLSSTVHFGHVMTDYCHVEKTCWAINHHVSATFRGGEAPTWTSHIHGMMTWALHEKRKHLSDKKGIKYFLAFLASHKEITQDFFFPPAFWGSLLWQGKVVSMQIRVTWKWGGTRFIFMSYNPWGGLGGGRMPDSSERPCKSCLLTSF